MKRTKSELKTSDVLFVKPDVQHCRGRSIRVRIHSHRGMFCPWEIFHISTRVLDTGECMTQFGVGAVVEASTE